jgi:hypothetical protein
VTKIAEGKGGRGVLELKLRTVFKPRTNIKQNSKKKNGGKKENKNL